MSIVDLFIMTEEEICWYENKYQLFMTSLSYDFCTKQYELLLMQW